MNFFDIKHYFKICDLDYDLDSFIMAITTERNTGKSTNVMSFCLEEYEKHGHKFIFLRTTGEQLKLSIKSFNEHYSGRYYMSGYSIFKLIPLNNNKKNGYEYEKITIGTTGFMSVETKFKSSGSYDDYRYIFWDEFNDLTLIPNLYDNLVNMIKTFQRFKVNFKILMLGNKDTANNPFLVNWGIETQETNEDDIIYEVKPKKVYYIDAGTNTFKHLNQNDGLANILAEYSEKMDRYMNRSGYRETGERNIINYQLRIQPTAEPLYNIIVKKNIFELGFFINKFNIKSVYLKLNESIINNDLETIILGNANAINQSGNIGDKQDEKEIAELIFHYAKQELLYYATYETKIIIDQWLNIILQSLN